LEPILPFAGVQQFEARFQVARLGRTGQGADTAQRIFRAWSLVPPSGLLTGSCARGLVFRDRVVLHFCDLADLVIAKNTIHKPDSTEAVKGGFST